MVQFDQPTRSEVIERNLGLVHACAHRFKGRGIEYEDLFQAGCIGLIKAADAFDTGRGVRFSTYAVPVILGEMRRLFRDGGAVKISRTIKDGFATTMGGRRPSRSWHNCWKSARKRLSKRWGSVLRPFR